MIPSGGTITGETMAIKEQPSLTWKLDRDGQRIAGRLDGIEAVKQAVYKILLTPRFRHLIYSPNYGSELLKLVGSNPVFLQSEITRMLEEALTQDERISSVENVAVTAGLGENLLVEFTVVSRMGSFAVTREVRI